MAKPAFDVSEWQTAFDRLDGPLKESLARRMGVSGATVLQTRAKANALIAENKEGVGRRGVISRAIYQVFSDSSTQDRFVYSISWNSKKSPHGHLIEFGHWQPYVTFKGKDGNWWTDKTRLLANPRWVPAYPFLRPAMDSDGDNAIKAMIERGRVELPKLLAGEKEA